MKAKQRHELHTNVLAEWISDTGDKLRPYSGAITAGLIALAIVVAIFFYLRGANGRRSVAASEQLISAMDMQNQGLAELQSTIKDFPGTSQASVAQLILAEALLDSGSSTLFHNKPAARENISRAMAAFDDVQKGTNDPMLRAWAIYGIGRAQESLGDLGQARLAYEQLAREYPDSALAAPARQHLNRLNQPAIKEFYDWFATQNPQPPPTDAGPGVPGLKPSFDLKEPTAPGDVKLPSAMGSGATNQSSGPAMPATSPSDTKSPAKSSSPQGSAPAPSKKPLESSK